VKFELLEERSKGGGNKKQNGDQLKEVKRVNMTQPSLEAKRCRLNPNRFLAESNGAKHKL